MNAQSARCSTLREAKLQLVAAGFDHGALAEQEAIAQRYPSLFRIALEFGDALNAYGVE